MCPLVDNLSECQFIRDFYAFLYLVQIRVSVASEANLWLNVSVHSETYDILSCLLIAHGTPEYVLLMFYLFDIHSSCITIAKAEHCARA